MPFEAAEQMMARHRADPAWQAGGLNAAAALGVSGWDALRAALVRNIGYAAEKTHLVKGFFNETLSTGAELARRRGMRPALLVDIDADLYTSARQALEFLLDAGLLVPGSFIHYDDFSDYDGTVLSRSIRRQAALRVANVTSGRQPIPKRLDDGTQVPEELRAHLEISDEYGLRWRQLGTLTGTYRGPVEGLSWINQRPSHLKGRYVPPQLYSPVYQLLACKRCGRGAG
eukprot:7391763-Prymnesium_polylepis.1